MLHVAHGNAREVVILGANLMEELAVRLVIHAQNVLHRFFILCAVEEVLEDACSHVCLETVHNVLFRVALEVHEYGAIQIENVLTVSSRVPVDANSLLGKIWSRVGVYLTPADIDYYLSSI